MTTAPRLDFVIAGVQKAGTTALAAYLAQHPEIALPAKKELHFFRHAAGQGRPGGHPLEWLKDHFGDRMGRLICGEATPVYMYWPWSLELIRDHNPAVRLIVSLRHPVERAWSGWSMEVRRGRETLSFSDAIRDGRSRVRDAPGGVHLTFSYVERGFYAEQIRRLLQLFPRDQVWFMRADEVAGHLLEPVTRFLGAQPFDYSPLAENVFPSSLPVTDEQADDFAFLQKLYERDISELPALTGLDVSDWLNGSAHPRGQSA